MTRKSLTGAKWKLCLLAAAVVGGVGALAATAKSGTPATPASGTPATKITSASATVEAPRLELLPGDHVALIGSGLAERMQYFGNFETLLHERFPTHKLVVRNLAWSADEPYLRPRSDGFGSPDQHLARQQADVVLMLFGFNESFAGPAGLPKFEQDLGRLIDDMRKQKYNGKSAPRLALISPIAFEDLGDPNHSDGKTQNANLRLYTAAMARVAAAKQVPLADIYAPSREVMQSSPTKLTIDGVHLSAAGDRRVAELLDAELFGAPPAGKARNSDALRAAVNEKSLQFFHRYRAINGCYIYGGRAHPFGVVSFPAEMKKLDQMTAIRDQRIWDIAQGKPVPEQIDDSKTEPLPQIKSNFGGQIVVRTPEDSRKQMTLAKGYEASLFASEVEFPDLKSPLQMTFDARGRLWVCTMPSYPQLVPGVPPDDRILVFEDTDGDGKADKETVFASGLHVATGFELGHGGVYVAQIPNMLFLQDTDGDGKADRQEVILSGFDSADSHHSEHTFTWGPDGGLYMQEGVFHHSQIESPYGPLRLQDAGIFRYEPRSGKVEAYVSYGFANPWGHVFDRWGQDYISDASGGHNYFAAPMSGHVDYPRKHSGGAPQLLPPQTRPNTECELVSSRQIRDEYQGNYLVGNVISFQGVLQYKLMAQGSGMVMKPVEPLLRSSDPTFRPTDVKFGPDGALYVIDWFNPLIGHMQHSLRDPKRDHSHGRIWRITAKDRPLVKPVQIAGQPIPVLLDLLKTYEDRTRYRVRRELWERKTADVMAALPTWIAGLDQKDPEYQRHLLEALWMHQAHNVVDEGLLKQLLNSPDARVRSASLRVLAQWRDRIDGALDQAIRLAGDADPHVRLEAVRAASFFRDYAAVSVVEQAAQKPQDESLRYTIRETLNTLQPYRDGTAHPPMSAFILNSYSNKDLLKLPRTELIHTAILDRAKIGRKQRLDSLQALAKLHKKDPAGELIVALKRQDAASEDAAAGSLAELGELLTSQPAAALAAQRSACEQLAVNGKRELSRQIAFAALVTCDNSFDKAEKLAEQNPQRLADLMAAVVRVPDGKLRAKIYSRAAALVRESDASVRHAAIGALPNLPGHEAEALEQIARCLREKIEPEAAIAALDQLPRGDWSAATAGSVAESLVDYLATLSIKQRTNATARTATALATSLLGRLPTSEGAVLRRRLDNLAVQIVKLGTVRENMRFDNSVVVVSAGWPVKIEFHNTDNMPHNLAVATPGSLADVGMAADALALKPEARERNFVPDMPQILHATRLLQDGESDSLTFVAPKQPGTFPLVCTYPGHWRRMYAALVVVPDRAAYQKSHPQLASAEKLLGLPEFTREYTIEDLVPSVTSLKSGRSFENGKMWFTTASCSSCHQIKGQGGNIGPDLTEVAKRYKPQEVLREIIDPSAVINEKFAAVEILLNDGRTVRGVIAEQNPKQIKLMPLGLTPGVCEPIVVARADIEENGITKSKISPMPKGLLNVMQQDQILDLLAYVLSGGDPKNPLFH